MDVANRFISDMSRIALAIQDAHYANVRAATRAPKADTIDTHLLVKPYQHFKKVKKLLNKMDWL